MVVAVYDFIHLAGLLERSCYNRVHFSLLGNLLMCWTACRRDNQLGSPSRQSCTALLMMGHNSASPGPRALGLREAILISWSRPHIALCVAAHRLISFAPACGAIKPPGLCVDP
jgi:hypothetical protein